MICPKCGTRYDDNRSACPGCGGINQEAHYVPVKKVRKKKHIFLILLLMLFLLCIGAAGGYYYYLHMIEEKCKEMTATAMDCAIKMDFTELDDKIPDQWKENANIKEYMTSQLEETIDQTSLGHLLNRFGIEADYEAFFQALTKRADYTIDDVSVTYNKCTVTLTTSNLNYPQLVEEMKEELDSLIEETTSGGNWWSQVTGWFSDFFQTKKEEKALPDSFSGWIDRLTEDKEFNKVTGTIVYGIKDGHWTLLDLDENLFYNLYGFPK
ncbi:MAG: hypothetical protein Q4E53_00645 [Eubacteriales bacterium]|nr:hypothetical protein [Eubacteriales bacterium]